MAVIERCQVRITRDGDLSELRTAYTCAGLILWGIVSRPGGHKIWTRALNGLSVHLV